MEKRDGDWPLLWIGVAGLCLAILYGFWFGSNTPAKIEDRIGAAASEKLSANGIDWADVKADGQKIILSGVAPSDAAKDEAIELARQSVGSGGVVSGGVTKVIDQTDIGQTVAPYTWSASIVDGRIFLQGYAPSRSDMSQIFSEAQSAFPGKVVNNMKLGAGAPDGGDWASVATFGLSQLKSLKTGRASLTDSLLIVEGEAEDQSSAEAIAIALMGITKPFSARSTVKGPFDWGARILDGQLVLEGNAPDEQSRDQLVAIAKRGFNGSVQDSMTIGGDEEWAEAAIAGLKHFSKFNQGQMTVSGKSFDIRGQAVDSVYQYLQEDMGAFKDAFSIQYAVNVVAPEVKEIEGIDLASGTLDERQEACQTAFLRIMSANRIYFKTAESTITRESGATLDKLLAVARRCSELSLLVEGHTDNRGARALNIRLSQKRAQAVADYLKKKGFDPDRLQAVGYGPDRPADTNDSPEGRANNRRIEFKVSN